MPGARLPAGDDCGRISGGKRSRLGRGERHFRPSVAAARGKRAAGCKQAVQSFTTACAGLPRRYDRLLMTVYTDYLWFNTAKRREIVRITDQVASIVEKSQVKDGMALVSAMHITAGVYVNDWESGLIDDIQEWVEQLAPARSDYRHHQTGEDNADAHLKRTLVGHQVILPITRGALDLGPWEQVFYAEFDGQRRKRVIVKVMGQ
jgi:secondary thiamine-phosphate synthase enzyme